ncbi:hypothetical protein ACI2JA_15695 [Alkalihalobacillus sp. NPDC078783]
MSYVVLEDFTDVKDKRKIYRKGDKYPRPANKIIDQKRLDQLASDKNRIGAPLIKKVESDQVDVIADGEVVETLDSAEGKEPAKTVKPKSQAKPKKDEAKQG